MTDFIKPVTMILTLQALHHLGRRQLSVGLIACFRFGASCRDAFLTETASHAAWARLAGPLMPIDSGLPAKAQHVVVYDGYALVPVHALHTADPPCLLGTETLRLESRRPGRPGIDLHLPGIRAQCFVEWRDPAGKRVRKLDAPIESVRVSPRLDCVWILYRAVTPMAGAGIDDIASLSADWVALDQPTARPGHCPPTGTNRRVIERHQHAAEREAWRQGVTKATCPD